MKNKFILILVYIGLAFFTLVSYGNVTLPDSPLNYILGIVSFGFIIYTFIRIASTQMVDHILDILNVEISLKSDVLKEDLPDGIKEELKVGQGTVDYTQFKQKKLSDEEIENLLRHCNTCGHLHNDDGTCKPALCGSTFKLWVPEPDKEEKEDVKDN